MTRRKWLWTAALAVPVAVAGSLYAANTRTTNYTCPITGENLPCEKCCPLNETPQKPDGYTCPITGENLPCEKCCPLNDKQQVAAQTEVKTAVKPTKVDGYVCPTTGEVLPCEKCCPLSRANAKK